MIGGAALGASPAVRPYFNRRPTGAAAVPTFVAANTLITSDPFRLGTTATSLALNILAGDIIVACFATRNSLAAGNPTVSIDGGGAPVITLVTSEDPGNTVKLWMYLITGAAAGARTVSFVPAGVIGATIPTGMGVLSYALRGATTSDRSAVSGGADVGPFVAGPTAALTVINQFDIAVVVLGADSAEDPRPWLAPFVDRTSDAGFDAANDVGMYGADRTSLTTAAVTATSGAIPDSTDFAMAVATFHG